MCESTNESYNMGVRYQTIRKRLDSLGYRQALSLDALPLTEKLLADLIQTTESLKHFKAIAENNIENYRHTSLSIDPYNYDNTKLVDENNQLHAQLLEIKENNLKQNKILQRKIQRLENDCSELQLASSKNLKKIKDLELESSNKSKRIQELLGKCCKPTISNVGLAAKKRSVYPLRRPVLECDPLPIDNSNRDFQYPNLTKVKPEIIDLVAMADRKISSLNREVIKLKDELSLQTDDMDTLRTQLSMKEKEINRLRKMQDSGRSYSAAIKKCSCRKNVSNCGQCNFISCRTPGDCSQSVCNKMADISEIKILQQAKLNLEQQLRDALDKQHDAMSQAMKLAERNEELEKELRDIDHVALAVEADCSSTVKQNNKRIVQLQEKLQNTTMKMHELENDLLVEKRMSQELRADLEGCKLENRNIQRTLDRACDEKEYLTKRIEELTTIASNDRKNSISTSTDNKINTNTKSFDDAANNSLKKMTDESKKLIEQLERDRDYYKDQWNKLNEQTNKTSDTENAELWSQICDLKHQLNENKTQVSELQREKRDLCREKFDLENQIQMFKSHNRNPCSHCTTCRSMSGCVCPSSAPTSGDSGIGSKLALTRLERERDSARADVERLMEERDLLHERLKLATEAHTCEQRRLREKQRDLEKKIEDIEMEKQNILIAQGSRQAALCGLEEQVRDAKNELRITKQELATQRTQYFQLRALQDQTDQALGDVQSQLIQSENELSKALERNKNLDEQQLQLDNQIIELKQTINTFHLNMADLDRENDKLRMELDEKTVCIAALEEEVKIKAQQTLNADNQLRDLHQKNQMYIDRAAEQERQLRNMQMEIENYQRKLNEMFADFERVGQENKRLQNDLTAVTCDSRSLQHELDESRAESQDLKRQLKTYVSEVHRVQELLNKKENERAEMLGHFRSLSLEAQDLENSNQNLECKAAEANGALQTARSRAIELEGQLTDKKCQIRSYEVQIAELTSRIANLESQVHQQKEYRAGIEADLNSLRDHCMKVDNEKHSLQNDFDNITDMNRRYENNLAQLKVEQKILNDQRNRDHAKIEHLEKLIDQEKRKSIDLHRVNQELKNEIGRLKERVTDLQRQLSAESAELRSYQTQAAEYNQQITKLRREVTDEKFNRAQKEEEHRRTIHYTTDTSTIPFEFNSGEPVRSTAPVVTFDSINSTDEMPHGVIRNTQASAAQNVPSRSNDPIHVAERTNKFDTIIGLHKDAHATDNEHEIIFAQGPNIGEPTQSEIYVPGIGSLCVRTSIEEDENHKDIRLQITDKPSRQLHTETAINSAPSTSSNCERKETVQSNNSTEIQVHNTDIIDNVQEKIEKKESEKIMNQLENELMLKSSTSSVKKPLIIEQTSSKMSFKDLLTNEKLSNTSVKNEKHESTTVSDEMKKNKSYEENTGISVNNQDIECCGCLKNNPLPNCIVHEYKDKPHVEFNLNDNNNNSNNNNNSSSSNIHDEGYDTFRLSKSPEEIPPPLHNKIINEPIEHLSFENADVPMKKISEISQTPEQNIKIPVTINIQDSTPVKIIIDDADIETQAINLSDPNEKLDEVREMTEGMEQQISLLHNIKSKHLSNDTNPNDVTNDSNNNEKKSDENNLESSEVSEFLPQKMSTPKKISSSDRSNKKRSTSRGTDEKSGKTIVYKDKTKINYPSDDENGEPRKMSRNRTLIVKSNNPNDKHQTAMRQKDITERGSSGVDKKSKKIDIKEKDLKSKLSRSKATCTNDDYDDNEDDDNDGKIKLRNDSSHDCERSRCLHCLFKYELRKSPRSANNYKSSERQVDYSRKKFSSSPEKSYTSRNDHSPNTKIHNFYMSGPAKDFSGSTSRSVGSTRDTIDQRFLHSHSNAHDERTTRDSQFSRKKSTATTRNINSHYGKF